MNDPHPLPGGRDPHVAHWHLRLLGDTRLTDRSGHALRLPGRANGAQR